MKNYINKILKAELLIKEEHLKYWAHYRIKFQYKYLHKNDVFSDVESPKGGGLSFSNKIFYIVNMLTKLNLHKLLFSRKKILIFSHPRANMGMDPNSKDIQDLFSDDALVVSHSEKLDFQGEVDSFTDFFRVFSKLLSKTFWKFFTHRKSHIQRFLDELNIEKENRAEYEKNYIQNSIEYNSLHFLYFWWLKTTKIEKLFLVTGYYNIPLIHAARKNNISTSELQHGVISHYHLGYNTLINNINFLCCDKIFFWGNYWKEACRLPVAIKKNILGNNQVNQVDTPSINKKNKTIVIISQVSISDVILNYVLANKETLFDYTVYYKLHPGEYWNLEFFRDAFSAENNISVVTNEYSLLELLSFCEYQIAAYSTGIFQGLSFNCKTIIIPSAGLDYIEWLVSSGMVKVSGKKLTVEEIEKINTPEFSLGYFFSEFDSTKVS